VRTLSTA